MSEVDEDNDSRTIIPYVGVDRVIETVQALYKAHAREIGISELATLMDCKVSNINNVSLAMGLPGLSETVNGKIVLTSEGMVFAQAMASNEEEKAKQIIKAAVGKSEVLKFVKSLLEARSEISGEEIGRALMDRFKKNWKDVRTYRAFGNSCASIISFAGYGYFGNGVLSLNAVTKKAKSDIYPPEIGYNPMISLLTVLNGYERAKLSELAQKLGTGDRSLWAHLAICGALGLVEKDLSGSYRITETGRKLLDPTLSADKKSDIFRACLYGSHYADVIRKMASADRDLTANDIGGILTFHLKRDWSPDTKEIYGKKFLTWLNAANLAVKSQRGLYRVKSDEAATIVAAEVSQPKTEKIDYLPIFEIGRHLGALEALAEDDRSKSFSDKVAGLKLLLQDHPDLGMLIDMLKTNYELAIASNNPSIFKTNLDFVRQKIKERMKLEAMEVSL